MICSWVLIKSHYSFLLSSSADMGVKSYISIRADSTKALKILLYLHNIIGHPTVCQRSLSDVSTKNIVFCLLMVYNNIYITNNRGVIVIKIVNTALYNVDLEGEDFGEFGGEHPTLVIRTKMEKDMYIAIPFTTYTKDRWEKMKQYMCCRVKSTNSIARIDKIEVITVDKIKNRWRENGKLLIPTKEDLDTVVNKAMAYFQASFSMGIREYSSVNAAFECLSQEFDEIVIQENIAKASSIVIDFENKDVVRIIFSSRSTNQISINELYDILNGAFNRKKYKVIFSGSSVIAEVLLSDS